MREDTEQLIKKNKIRTLGFKKSYEGMEKILKDNEKLLYVCNGNFMVNNVNELEVNMLKIKGKKPTVFAITDSRIIFYFKILFNEECSQIPIDELREYDFKRDGITGGVLRIITLTKCFDLDLNYKKETMNAITEALEEAKKGKNAENHLANNFDNISKIRELSQLKDDGIISEEEFINKKSELLKQI